MAIIVPLSEGEFTVGGDKQFIPFNSETDNLEKRQAGSLLLEVQPFLIETARDILIFDTGLGQKNSIGNLQIHTNILKAGYSPEEITKVFHSHLHKDHAGGMTYKAGNGMVVPTFPNANYYLYQPEVEYALKTGAPAYDIPEIEALLINGQVKWLSGDEGVIDEYIHFYHSGGHCPQHIILYLDDGDDKILFGGDEIPQLKQLKIRYLAKYDFDGKKALDIREVYGARGKKEGWKFLFYHDVKNPIAVL